VSIGHTKSSGVFTILFAAKLPAHKRAAARRFQWLTLPPGSFAGCTPEEDYSLGAPFALGPPSSAEPANTLLPLGNFTDRELHVLVPSFARKPSTVT